MTYQCEFMSTVWFADKKRYTCKISNQKIFEDKDNFYVGPHESGKNYKNVTGIWFYFCEITKVPQKLISKFPNLQAMSIENSGLRSLIRSDIVEYKNLESFEFDKNSIESLPGNLFVDFGNLTDISFSDNNLTFIEPNILDGLGKIGFVNFTNNPNYDKCFSNSPPWSNATLQQVKDDLFTKFSSKFKFVQDLKKSNENLSKEVRKLGDRLNNQKFQNSKYTNELKQEISHWKQSTFELKTELEGLKKQLNSDLVKKNFLQMEELKKDFEKSKQENQTLLDLNAKLTQEIQDLKFSEKKLSQMLNAPSGSQQLQSHDHLFIDLQNLTQDETFKDFKIIIDDREFPVHKFLLAARSPTLAEMLRNNPEVENLKLVDISVEIFELILKFLYTDEFPNEDGANFLHLFAAAGRLKIKELKNLAAIKLFEKINKENALEILNLSNKYGHDELRRKALEEIKKNYPKIEFKDEWAEDGEKIVKIIKAFELKEEMMQKIEKEFKKVLN